MAFAEIKKPQKKATKLRMGTTVVGWLIQYDAIAMLRIAHRRAARLESPTSFFILRYRQNACRWNRAWRSIQPEWPVSMAPGPLENTHTVGTCHRIGAGLRVIEIPQLRARSILDQT
ncbi:MAG: hypothetical protein ACI83P_002756 [Janthinobacterium sp.]|jgi:hypothetical protein